MKNDRPVAIVALLGLLAIGFYLYRHTGEGRASAGPMGLIQPLPGMQQAQGSQGMAGATSQAPALLGVVERVDGNRITVRNPFGGGTTTVELGSGSKVRRQTAIQPTAIRPGDTITAVGSRDGDLLQAHSVTVGGTGIGDVIGGEVPVGAVPSAREPGLLRAGAGPGAHTALATVSGTVQNVKDRELTLRERDGATVRIQIMSDARVRKSVEVAPSQIRRGDTIAVLGTRTGGVIRATEVEISDAPPFQP